MLTIKGSFCGFNILYVLANSRSFGLQTMHAYLKPEGAGVCFSVEWLLYIYNYVLTNRFSFSITFKICIIL